MDRLIKVRRFDRKRCAIAERLMQPLPIVEDFDEVEDRDPCLVVSGEGAMVDEFIFER